MIHIHSTSKSNRNSLGRYCRQSMLRQAFTLIELLVVMMILSILASIVLFALASVQESARDMKTRATIQKLNALVMEKYEAYRTRRVPVDILKYAHDKTLIAATDTVVPPKTAAKIRLDCLRELMRIEMPDRYTDISDAPKSLPTAPAIQAKYQDKVLSTKTPQFQGAECLYLFIKMNYPDFMEQFSASEIGDSDEDGMLEFHDGWDRPIQFFRWAPGFYSPLQPEPVSGVTRPHDPFDPFGVYADTYPLYPLIYSPGPDKISDYWDGTSTSGGPFQYSTTIPANDPYGKAGGDLIGTPMDVSSSFGPANGEKNWFDNITNHDLGGD